jgi:hypothetical protein
LKFGEKGGRRSSIRLLQCTSITYFTYFSCFTYLPPITATLALSLYAKQLLALSGCFARARLAIMNRAGHLHLPSYLSSTIAPEELTEQFAMIDALSSNCSRT